MEKESKRGLSASFKVGAIALAFLIVGYQSSLFIHKAAMLRIAANRDHPDTVFVADEALVERIVGGLAGDRSRAGLSSGGYGDISPGISGSSSSGGGTVLKDGSWGNGSNQRRRSSTIHSESGGPHFGSGAGGYSSVGKGGTVVIGRSGSHDDVARRAYDKSPARRVESFRFNPNTATLDDFQRLGFTERQAQSILNYREKGGRFRRKSDFAKSYVVADSVFERLEPFIDIPLLDINAADSAAFDALPGIGPYFAAKMVSHRAELGGYSYPEQLMDIYRFDQEKFDALADLIAVGPSDSLALWTLDETALARHPYIDKRAAHDIVLFRNNNSRPSLSVDALVAAGILSPANGSKLARCRISKP